MCNPKSHRAREVCTAGCRRCNQIEAPGWRSVMGVKEAEDGSGRQVSCLVRQGETVRAYLHLLCKGPGEHLALLKSQKQRLLEN